MEIRIVPSEVEHLFLMVDRIHEGNEREAEALAGISAFELLKSSVENSIESWTVLADETPVAVYGIATVSALSGEACPWLVCTDDIRFAGLTFLRQFRKNMENIKSRFDRLKCMIYNENTEVVRMLEWIGFHKRRELCYGVSNEVFYEMVWEGSDD